ncbi:MAG: phosphodiester glycosidase family protein [Tannerella sp.]|jgi:hypothetical protein|nr:phosphodiester glycosidase family protein [Tannerella sp.]
MKAWINIILCSLALPMPAILQAENITIGGTPYAINTVETVVVADGVTCFRYDVPDYPLKFSILTVDCRKDKLTVEAWSAKDYARGVETPLAFSNRKTAEGSRVLAVVNGDLGSFSSNVLCAGEMIGGELAQCVTTPDICPSPGNGTPCAPHIGIDRHGRPVVDILRFKPFVKRMDGDRYDVSGVNINADGSPVARGNNQLVIYNGYVARDSTATNEWGVEYLVAPVHGWLPDDDGNIRCAVERIRPIDNGANSAEARRKMPIVKGKAVLSAHGNARVFLGDLGLGDELYINWGVVADGGSGAQSLTHIVGGSDIILKDGVPQEPFFSGYCAQNSPNPRTAAGCSADGNTLILAAVDGRQASQGMAGVTTKRLGDIMKFAGADVAINLDGGGSTCMVADGAIRNSPSENRAIFNGLLVAGAASTAIDIAGTAGENVLIGPSPAEKTVCFRMPSTATAANMHVALYDRSGREVKTASGSRPSGDRAVCIAVDDLPPGVYLYEITGDVRPCSGKLIVK